MIQIPTKLIQAAVAAALFAAATGQLPKFIQQVRVAQYQLLKDSQASKWGKPMLLPVKKQQRARLGLFSCYLEFQNVFGNDFKVLIRESHWRHLWIIWTFLTGGFGPCNDPRRIVLVDFLDFSKWWTDQSIF